jgi:hypothetical protein
VIPPDASGPAPAPSPEEAPPLGSWARAYALVLAALLVELVLLGWLTERYR